MDEYESLSHTTWDCKYHVVFIPKCRRKTLYQELRRHLGEVFRRLAHQRESKVEEGHPMPDHVHMLLSIPPKYDLRTADAVTPFLTTRAATISLVVFCAVYIFIFAFGILYIYRLLRAGPVGRLVLPPLAAMISFQES